ncbi:MAG TPA: thiamine-phosphate kinase [Dongiaceae bacterium]
MQAKLAGEFALIEKYFAPLAKGFAGAVNLEDDACTYLPPAGKELVITADALVENRHYLSSDPPDCIAKKMLRVNLSDLAAKGARPVGYLMTTAFGPDIDEAWVAKFASGLAEDQALFGISLMGGDTVATPGPTTLSVTAIGTAPIGKALRRGGAQPGDRLFVTGTIGDGLLGLRVLQGALVGLEAGHARFLTGRNQVPQPRTDTGPALLETGIVHAAMDISDGLVADAGHIAEASHCGLVIRADRVPLSPAASEVLAADLDLLESLLTGGDDYEILFTARDAAPLQEVARKTGVPITEIGEVVTGSGVSVVDRDGAVLPLKQTGFQHF